MLYPLAATNSRRLMSTSRESGPALAVSEARRQVGRQNALLLTQTEVLKGSLGTPLRASSEAVHAFAVGAPRSAHAGSLRILSHRRAVWAMSGGDA